MTGEPTSSSKSSKVASSSSPSWGSTRVLASPAGKSGAALGSGGISIPASANQDGMPSADTALGAALDLLESEAKRLVVAVERLSGKLRQRDAAAAYLISHVAEHNQTLMAALASIDDTVVRLNKESQSRERRGAEAGSLQPSVAMATQTITGTGTSSNTNTNTNASNTNTADEAGASTVDAASVCAEPATESIKQVKPRAGKLHVVGTVEGKV